MSNTRQRKTAENKGISTKQTLANYFMVAVLLSSFLICLFSAENTQADNQKIDDLQTDRDPAVAQLARYQNVQTALRWSLIPSAGHWYLDDEEEIRWYGGSLLSLTALGLWLDDENDELDRDQVNLFWLMAFKGWELSLFTTYRNALIKNGFDLNQWGVDDTPLDQLFTAPFQRQTISDPWVWGAAVFGAAVGLLQSPDRGEAYSDIKDVEIFADNANRTWGTVGYTASAFAVSLGAGVAEEALWRGVLQNQMEHRYGKDKGLWWASGLFGSAHLLGLNGSANLRGGVFATAAGYYLGHLFQRNHHRLAKPIAAHFWYNFAAMTTAFLRNPEDNPFGIDLRYDF